MTRGAGEDLPPGPGRDLVHLFQRLRAGRDWTTRQMAQRAGVSPSYLSEVFGGRKTPRPATAAKIVTALRGNDDDVRQAWLLAERQGELHRHQRRHAGRDAPVVAPPISGLPRQDPQFTGREEELRLLTDALTGGRANLCAIYGMAGSGKTTLAVQAAAMLADHFPDGIVFLDLHGATQERPALTAGEAVDRLLRRMHVAGEMIPADVDERTALYRHLLHRRRLLLLLDDAHHSSQVRPLLPAAGACAVVVTGRRRLTALDEAMALSLDVLSPNDGVALFRTALGTDRIRAEPGADELVRRVVDLCGRLPLAIRIAAGRLRARNRGSLSELVDRLEDETERLHELDDDDRSVAASLQMSIKDLPAASQRTVALLALHPGRDIAPLAAAALADGSAAQAVRHLTDLAARHLIVEYTPNRFRFHDLVHLFTRHYATRTITASDQARALHRLIDYYLRAADAADRLITPQRYRVPLDVLDRTLALPRFAEYDDALAWLTTEETNLTDVCLAAGQARLDIACWQLAYTLRGYFFLTKNPHPWIATHTAALAAARRAGDEQAQAMTLNNLGMALAESGQDDDAASHYRQALQLFTAANDAHGVNTSRANLAWLHYGQGRLAEFLADMRPVLAFYRKSGAIRNMAITLRGMGLAQGELGHVAESIADLNRALDAFTAIDARLDIAMTCNALGETYQLAGDNEPAAAAFTEGLAASKRCGSQYEQARAHHRLGQLAAAAGNNTTAASHWTEALHLYQQLGAPQAADVQRAMDATEVGATGGRGPSDARGPGRPRSERTRRRAI